MSLVREVSTTEYFKAVEECNIPEVEDVLATGAIDVDLQNPNFYNRTALHVAACNGSCDLARLLVDKFHASVNIADGRGQIPLQVATDYRNINIVKFLLQRGSNHREYAARYLNSEEVEDLFRAAETNDIEEVVRLIHEHNIDVNTEDGANWNRTVLETAASYGYEELVRVLVDDFHADVTHSDDLEENALVKAINNDYDNIANFLLEKESTGVTSESSDESDLNLNLLLN